MTTEKLSKLVNQSGFPLQIGIASLVNRTWKNGQGWKVLYSEHSWRNESAAASGFIDIVLENQFRTVVLVVECKRVLDSSWIFLQPGARLDRRHAKAWVTRYAGDTFKWFDWRDLTLDPVSPESEYCVVPGQDAKAKPMLERVAADVVAATEGIAWEERILYPGRHVPGFRMYFSVIVTTARLTVGIFDPERISIADGTLSETTYETVPYLRFRKQLSNRASQITSTGWDVQQALIRAKEHTVFVVNSDALIEFLSAINIDGSELRDID